MPLPVKLTPAATNRIAARLREIPQRDNCEHNDRSLTKGVLFVKFTGFAGGIYQWAMRFPDKANPGQYVAPTTARTGTNAHTAGMATGNGGGAFVGLYGWIKFLCFDGTKAPHYVVVGMGSLLEMEVDLTQDNGAGHNGNATTAASFTYTPADLSGNAVKNAAGTTLTAMTPTHNRRIGYTTAATQGTLVFKPDGSVVLRWTDEVAGTVQRSC
jgi:hypothetical protein